MIWYLLGAIIVLHFLPLGTTFTFSLYDIHLISFGLYQTLLQYRYSCALDEPQAVLRPLYDVCPDTPRSLSWADTAASTFGRLWGRYTPPLPARVPILGLPLAPRKSLAGFIAASVTGAVTAVGFWRYGAQIRLGSPQDISWSFEDGFRLARDDAVGHAISDAGLIGFKAAGWLGLGLIGLTAGLVSGIAEALGQSCVIQFQ